jgi:hypothetical protein
MYHLLCTKEEKVEGFMELTLLHGLLHVTGSVTYLGVILNGNLTCERKKGSVKPTLSFGYVVGNLVRPTILHRKWCGEFTKVQ